MTGKRQRRHPDSAGESQYQDDRDAMPYRTPQNYLCAARLYMGIRRPLRFQRHSESG